MHAFVVSPRVDLDNIHRDETPVATAVTDGSVNRLTSRRTIFYTKSNRLFRMNEIVAFC